jgi:hypothetical protein
MTPLPDMNRLLTVWQSAKKSVTSLEHATQVFVTMWTMSLADLDIRNIDDWPNKIGPGDTGELNRMIARTIDDEVTWHLGNRLESVILIDDDHPRIVTVGELIGRISMFAVLLDKWPTNLGDCPIAPAFVEFGQQYESLATGLVAGSRRQPRRRSHGAPPIPRPRRIGPGITPWPICPGR